MLKVTLAEESWSDHVLNFIFGKSWKHELGLAVEEEKQKERDENERKEEEQVQMIVRNFCRYG